MSERITLIVRRMLLVSAVFSISGCALKPADNFNLEVDLPANFRFRGDAVYRPATGETCTLPKRRGKRPEFKVFDTAGKPVANRVSFDVPLTEQVNGCPLHAIRKIMKCNSLDASGQLRMGRAGGVVQREPLRGRTLRMALGLTDQEQPAVDDNWVAVPEGWKRCMGESLDDVYAYCRGNTTDFKPIQNAGWAHVHHLSDV